MSIFKAKINIEFIADSLEDAEKKIKTVPLDNLETPKNSFSSEILIERISDSHICRPQAGTGECLICGE